MPHIMLDLETYGTKAGCVLRSIGAVAFDLPGASPLGDRFYANLDTESQLAAGLTIDRDTERWWTQQSEAAQKALLVDQRPFPEVAREFHEWYGRVGGRTLWAQGSNFDPVLWEAACAAFKIPVPWKFWDTRDTRTAYDMGRFNTKIVARGGTYHNALDDAVHQATCVQMAYQRAWGEP